jgi:hypothetical protein
MTEEKQMRKYTDEELLKQKEALTNWVRVLTREGASPTLMQMALTMVNEEMDRRGLKDEDKST